jgi:sulfur carrier protein ThiS
MGFLVVYHTAACIRAAKNGIDDRCRAAYANLNGNGLRWAVQSTCAALHAGVSISNMGSAVRHNQDSVRANLEAHAAADAFLPIQFQA